MFSHKTIKRSRLSNGRRSGSIVKLSATEVKFIEKSNWKQNANSTDHSNKPDEIRTRS